MKSKKIETVGFECNSVPFLIRQSMAGPSVLAEIVGTHPSPFPAGSGNGGREMAWRVVATVLSTVLVLADPVGGADINGGWPASPHVFQDSLPVL